MSKYTWQDIGGFKHTTVTHNAKEYSVDQKKDSFVVYTTVGNKHCGMGYRVSDDIDQWTVTADTPNPPQTCPDLVDIDTGIGWILERS